MKQKIIFLTLFTCLLGGCTERILMAKKVDYPQETRSGMKYLLNEKDLSGIAWWKKFQDPLLDKLVLLALSSNNTIKSAEATIRQAEAQLKSAQYAWIPTLDGSAHGFAGTTWNTHVVPSGSFAATPLFSNVSNPRFRGYYTGFVPGYTFNILNNISNIKSAEASLAVQEASAQSTRLSIISQMSGAYFMLLSQREQLAVENTICKDLRKLHALEKVRFQKGASNLETILSLEQQLAEEEAKIPLIENVIVRNENTIHLLMGQKPQAVYTHKSLNAFPVSDLIPANLPASVLKNRPDIMIALNNVHIASAQIGVAWSAYFPTISLTGLLGKASLDLTNLLKIGANLWIVQAAASMKILNASAWQNVKAAKAEFRARYYDYLQTLYSAFADVDDNIANVQKNRNAYLKTQKAFLAAKKSWLLTKEQYKAGAKDYRSVMNAKIILDRSHLSLVQEKAQLLDSIVQFYNSVAGGSCSVMTST